MANARRVQCGAPECERLTRNARQAARMAGYRAADREYGRRMVERDCAGCGALLRVRAEKLTRFCVTCAARVGGVASAAVRVRLPAEVIRSRNRDRKRIQKARRRARDRAVRLPADRSEALRSRRERLHAKHARRRARLRGAACAPFRRQQIFERDHWTCMLCHGALARTEVVPHPFAPTIDHVVPLARGGAHAPWNVQAAHFICNSRKSDRIEVP